MSVSTSAHSASVVRRFGRFQLLQLLGKSARTMMWLAADPRDDRDLVLAMPRHPAGDRETLERWQHQARKASRVEHPALERVVEFGDVGSWPYIAYGRGQSVTLAEKWGRKCLPAPEVVSWSIELLQGLAFAHEAGIAHRDLQLVCVLLGDGSARLIGLGVALPDPAQPDGANSLQLQREAAEHDVLSFGLLVHQALAGAPALDQPDLALAMHRMPPWGRDGVRLPWSSEYPIPEPLRAIVNRATDRQERQRYRSARTFCGALEGWWRADGEHGGGPMALLVDRLRSVGLLPSVPGGAARAARLALMESKRTNELAEIVLQDVALTFELLRQVNSVQLRNGMAAGTRPVLTIRRTIAMLGLDGVRRAALALRPWPGPLDDAQAAQLRSMMDGARLAGRLAQWLRPRGYDPEVVYLIALMQNLGRLVVQYHFPDEAQQIRRLMQAAPPEKSGEAESPGMNEEAASFAVLGIDIEALGVAVGRYWGLEDTVLAMIRRPSTTKPIHGGESDADMLRLAAGCANEIVDALSADPARRNTVHQRLAQRYGRALALTAHDIELAVQDALAIPEQAGVAGGVSA